MPDTGEFDEEKKERKSKRKRGSRARNQLGASRAKSNSALPHVRAMLARQTRRVRGAIEAVHLSWV